MQVITNSQGVATAPTFTANGKAGSYVVTATVPGIAGQADFDLTNDLAATGTVVVSSLNPSAYGSAVTFTAVVAPPDPNYGTPSGDVEILDGTNVLGTVPLQVINGIDQANFTTSTLAVGLHYIAALYMGDTNFLVSLSPDLTQQVSGPITVTSSANPSVTGQPITITATLTGATGQPPSGDMDFYVVVPGGGQVLAGSEPIDANGQAQLTDLNVLLPPGYPIIASYAGDVFNPPATSAPYFQQVNAADTTLGISAAQATVGVGQADTITTIINPVPPGAFVVAPTGTISFYDSLNGGPAMLLGSFQIGGSASVPSFSVPGVYTVYATFTTADGNFNSSQSSSITITVTGSSSPSVDPPLNLSNAVAADDFNSLTADDAAFLAYFLAGKNAP